MIIKQYGIYLINLDPTIGHEIKKIRPCLVISPNEMNDNIETTIIAPLTTKSHNYPTRLKTKLNDKECWIVLDQIRTVDKKRFIKKLNDLGIKDIEETKNIIREMLVD
jgi:mRNA interferase MazF